MLVQSPAPPQGVQLDPSHGEDGEQGQGHRTELPAPFGIAGVRRDCRGGTGTSCLSPSSSRAAGPGPPRQISLGGSDREGREKRSWIFPEFAAKSSELQSEQLRFWKALRRSKCEKPRFFFFCFVIFLPIMLFYGAVSHLTQRNEPSLPLMKIRNIEHDTYLGFIRRDSRGSVLLVFCVLDKCWRKIKILVLGALCVWAGWRHAGGIGWWRDGMGGLGMVEG